MSNELAAAAAAWFSEALGQPCKLVRQQLGSRHALSSVKEDDASESQDGSSDVSSASGAALGGCPRCREVAHSCCRARLWAAKGRRMAGSHVAGQLIAVCRLTGLLDCVPLPEPSG